MTSPQRGGTPPSIVSARRQVPGLRPNAQALPGSLRPRVPIALRVRVAESLARLLGGGRSLLEALDDLRSASRNRRLTAALTAMAQGLRDGALLSDAAARAPELFSPGERGLLEVGERTGRLPEVLGRLAGSLGRQAEVRRRLWRSAAYPAFLLATSALSLPLPSLVSSSGVKGYLVQAGTGLGILALVVVVAALVPTVVARLNLGAPLRRLAWTLPLVRSLYRPRVRADTLHAAAIALSSGLGLPETLRLAGLASADPSATHACREIARRVEAGSDLASAIDAADFLPPADLLMVTGGERGGDLDVVLVQLAEQAMADHARRMEIALRVAGWLLLVAVMATLAVQILGQAQGVTGIPDSVLRDIEREMPGIFKPLK